MLFATPALAQFSASLNWTDNADNETGFVIERQLNKGAWQPIGAGVGANIVTYTDATLQQTTTPNEYCYRVMAWNTADGTPSGTVQSSAPSNVACKTVAASIPPPNAPTSLTISFLQGSGELRIGNRHFRFTEQDGNIEITQASKITVDIP